MQYKQQQRKCTDDLKKTLKMGIAKKIATGKL